MRLLLVAALLGAVAISGAAASAAAAAATDVALGSEDNSRIVSEFTYLFSTDLYKRQSSDVVRTFDTVLWDNGLNPKGMHKCARMCNREGGGGVCLAWTMCWDQRRCHLFSRLPEQLTAARPHTAVNLLMQRGAGDYNARCSSGFSKAAATSVALASDCSATIHSNTLLSDVTMSFLDPSRSRELKAAYDANQPDANACCKLCAENKGEGCNAWSYDPTGWVMDRAHKCTLRQGSQQPAVSVAKGITSGFMNAPSGLGLGLF
ncbi:MAG: hypothetical protein J3K34DRAFT_411201 [Monoraphidium minutum]|nr:MAG: hypothetical protein J3K34DRAFT_411201 [Monoraphidium minutum]